MSRHYIQILGQLIALALIYGCPGPRNLIEGVANQILKLPIAPPKLTNVPQYERRQKMEIIGNATTEEEFRDAVNNFPERQVSFEQKISFCA